MRTRLPALLILLASSLSGRAALAAPCFGDEGFHRALQVRSLVEDLADADGLYRDDLAFSGFAVPWFGEGFRPETPRPLPRIGGLYQASMRSISGARPCGDTNPMHRASLSGTRQQAAALWSDPRLSLEIRAFHIMATDGREVVLLHRESETTTLESAAHSREMTGFGVRHPYAEILYGSESGNGHYLRLGIPVAGFSWDAIQLGGEKPAMRLGTVEYPLTQARGEGKLLIVPRWAIGFSGESRPRDHLAFFEPRVRVGLPQSGLSLYASAATEIEPVDFHAATLGASFGLAGLHPSGLMWVKLGLFTEATLFDGRAGPKMEPGFGTGAWLSLGSGPFTTAWQLDLGTNRPDRLRDLPGARDHVDVGGTVYVRWTPALPRRVPSFVRQ